MKSTAPSGLARSTFEPYRLIDPFVGLTMVCFLLGWEDGMVVGIGLCLLAATESLFHSIRATLHE